MITFNNNIISDNKIVINGEEIQVPNHIRRNNVTLCDGGLYVGGYEYKNGKWKRSLTALYHLFF